jgi:exocyst complex component 2
MALDIIKLLISLQSEFFMLSDMAVMLTSRHAVTLPPLLPLYTNTFTTGHYLVKILAELQDGINDINGMDISGEVGNELKGLLESTKWRFEDILITAWLRGT